MQIKALKSEFHPPFPAFVTREHATRMALHRTFPLTLPRVVFRSAPTVSTCSIMWPPTPLCGWTSLFNQDPTAGYLAYSLGGSLACQKAVEAKR